MDTKIAEHLAAQWRAQPEGCRLSRTPRSGPIAWRAQGFGLQLADLAFGTNHHEAFDVWWDYARGEYLHLDADEPPAMVTFYYDPVIDEHLEVPAIGRGPSQLSTWHPKYPTRRAPMGRRPGARWACSK